MSGYFGEALLTREVLSEDGWLDTGDLAYRVAGSIVITGRRKDLIIINGCNIWPQDIEHLAEQHPDLRTGSTSAFSVSSPHGQEMAVLVVETRRSALVSRLKGDIGMEFGIDGHIGLAPRGTLPRTTSGKLSRSGARKIFLEQVAKGSMADPFAGLPEPLNRNMPQIRAFGQAHARDEN
jgi:fatty-acyl-CoA synthase